MQATLRLTLLAFAAAGAGFVVAPVFGDLWEPTAHDQAIEAELVRELQRRDVGAVMTFVRANNAAREGDHRKAARLYGIVERRVPAFTAARRLRIRETLARGWKESAVDEWRALVRSEGSVDDIVSLASFLTRSSTERREKDALLEEALTLLAGVRKGGFRSADGELVRARIGAASGRWELVEEAQRNLVQGGIPEAYAWWAMGQTTAEVGAAAFAERALGRARAMGLSREDETAANRRYLQTMRPRRVETKQTFALTSKLLRLLMLPLAALFVLWLGLLLLVLGFGVALGRRVEDALHRWESGGPEPATALEATWSRGNDRLVRIGSAQFWAGLPIALGLSLAVTATLGAAVLEVSSGNGFFALLWILPTSAATLAAFWQTFRRWRGDLPGPEGPRLDLATEDLFRLLLDETAAATRGGRIDRVLLLPDCVFAVARYPASGGGRKVETVLAVGVGLLEVVNVSELRAILAHEYGHLVDWGGGGLFAIRVRDRLQALAVEMHRRGAIGLLNPAWWFVALFAWAFSRLSFGASRFQEYQSDRIAAEITGTEVCISALNRSVEATSRFAARAQAVLDDAIENFVAIENLYSHPVPGASPDSEHEIQAAVDAELSATDTDPWSSHPPVSRRLAWFRRMAEDRFRYPAGEHDPRPAWSLFRDREGIERRATELFRKNIDESLEIRLRVPEAS